MKKIYILMFIFIIFISITLFQIFNIYISEFVWLPEGVTQEDYVKHKIIEIIVLNWSILAVISIVFLFIKWKNI